jgi:PAS domain S-box-containing protein
LPNSEENIKTYLENAPDGVYLNDLQGNFLYGNKKAEEILGYSREELIGKSFLKLSILPAKYLAKAGKLLALNAIGRPTGPDEFELIRKDKSHTWVEISTAPIKQGGKTVVIGFVRDVAERRRAEEALKESQKKYATLVERSTDGILIIRDGLVEFANSRLLGMASYTLDEVLGKPFLEFVAPEHQGLVAERYQRRLAGEEAPNNYEIEILAKDGRKIPVEINASRIEYKGAFADMVIIRDITERKQAEELHRTLTNSSPASIYIGQDNNYIYINPAFQEASG